MGLNKLRCCVFTLMGYSPGLLHHKLPHQFPGNEVLRVEIELWLFLDGDLQQNVFVSEAPLIQLKNCCLESCRFLFVLPQREESIMKLLKRGLLAKGRG